MKFKWNAFAIALLLAVTAPVNALPENGLKFVETADGRQSARTRELVQWTHSRLVFEKTLKRVAVGQESTMQVEVLGANEVLALAKKVGRTSIMVWYTDGSSETFLFSVVEDLSVLRRALSDIHPNIRIQLAPDRAALVLRGKVPTVDYRMAAESAARNYLDVGLGGGRGSVDVLMQSADVGAMAQDANFRVQSSANNSPRRNTVRGGATVINLIQVETLPLNITEKLKTAISGIGGEDVTIRRIQRGDLQDNMEDTLILAGSVENQVVLTRVLNIASRLFTGQDAESDMRAITNESGGLTGGRSNGGGNSFGSGGSSLGGGGGLGNDLSKNIGRSTLVSVGGGRILSMIDVRDLPQVRVSVQMHEISRSRLKSWRPDLTAVSNGYDNSAVFGLSGSSQKANGASQVETALQVLGGTLLGNIQVGGSDMAFDLLFSLLEEEGISRTLSRPTLTVLAGETATFRAGGEVPVPRAFAPSGLSDDDSVGSNAAGVFSGTDFKSFGVELEVRAMVGENDKITLDLRPTISMPDTKLTQDIAGSTGSSLNSTAFNVRTINTSTRLVDGQPLIIGGLVSRDVSDNESHTPGLSSVPVLGNLAKSSSKNDSDRELIIVVTPTIVREPKHEMALWQFPANNELLLRSLVVAPKGTRNYSNGREK
ncbi:pilus assembly protein N-terminal domain-containing protein [Zhongshania sp.]|uniref:pilus assembly protein N-terminal domain-containing protein n=1 Tax=Zhongshania sp. TaxID=1971902 RepID=UPI003568B3E2